MSSSSTPVRRRAACLLVLALALAGCGGGGGGGPSGEPPAPVDDPGPPAPLGGLDRRPSNASCLAPPRPSGFPAVTLARIFPQAETFQPVALLQAPGDDDRWFVVEKGGRVLVLDAASPDGAGELFVDLSDRVDATFDESGLLGMAFHPNFATNGEVFLSYTAPGAPLLSIVSRFTVAGGRLERDSERVLLELPQPSAQHQGGGVGFGPDGYLYVGFGDGGVPEQSQDNRNLFGALLRLDVDGGTPYAIPPDNPTALRRRPEIFAWGFRNPWRWSFDRLTGDLWLADVGEDAREEIDRVTPGGNYGWPWREGFACRIAGACDDERLIPPLIDYGPADGCVVIGGYVYRGRASPALAGLYLYGDFCTGFIYGLSADAPADGVAVAAPRLLFDSGLHITSFGQGHDGEVYVTDLAGGLHRIVARADEGAARFPHQLSATGCVDPLEPTRAATGLIPYDLNVPFWSDGADKERWLAIPDGTVIAVGADGDFDLPIGSVVMKHFRLQGRVIETRLFVRHEDGRWAGYSYAWDDAQTDATYVPDGLVRRVGDVEWIYPSGAHCMRCHTEAAGRTLGLESAQLNRDLHYPTTGRTANQLLTLDAIGVLVPPLGASPAALPALPATDDGTVPLAERARAYLHANCSHCHRPGGAAFVDMDLRASAPLHDSRICDVPPSADLGIVDARRLAAGDPERSLLPQRMGRRDGEAMPPLASSRSDGDGVALIEAWIASIAACP